MPPKRDREPLSNRGRREFYLAARVDRDFQEHVYIWCGHRDMTPSELIVEAVRRYIDAENRRELRITMEKQ